MPRDERHAVAGAHQDVAVGVGGAVGCSVDRKARLEGGIDEAVHQLPVQAPLPAAEREVESLAARAADIGEVAGVGGGGDELYVVAVDGAKRVGAPHQPLLGEAAAYADLGGPRHHLL